MNNIFYQPNIEQQIIVLNKTEAHHVFNVFRIKEGEEIFLFDNKANKYRAIVKDVKKNLIEIIDTIVISKTKNYYLHIAISPTKNIERFELFLEKAVEMGIDEVTPIICKNTERKLLKLERVEKIIIAAMKQSQNLIKPILNDLISFDDFIKKQTNYVKLLANKDFASKKISELNLNKQDILIVIGPEGDFSKKEIDLAIANNFEIVSLSNSRLRVETAALLACAVVNNINL